MHIKSGNACALFVNILFHYTDKFVRRLFNILLMLTCMSH
jgi:hypothetical protein